MAVKKRAKEKLDDANIRHVIEQLEKGITKKQACAILNISYNTSRLNKIIEEFHDNQDYRAKRKAENKGKPANNMELQEIAQCLLEGDNYSSIAKQLYRSTTFVKNVADRLGIPQRVPSTEGTSIQLLPEQCVAEEFKEGEIVWSAKYNSPAIVKEQIEGDYEEKYGSKAYWVAIIKGKVTGDDNFFPSIERADFNAACLAYDLGSLKHLENLKIRWDLL